MIDFKIGGFVVSKAGHDFGKQYVIFHIDQEYVYLVDGIIRTIDRPKKKKLMHVNYISQFDQKLADKVINRTVKNEEIKRSLKMLQYGNSGKEVE
jgi:ribosomal protein L14E/L6E/L27E